MITFLLCCIEADLSASDVRSSENVAYSSANVKTCGNSEAYDYIHVRTPESDYATVDAGNMQNFHFFLNLISNLIFSLYLTMVELLCEFEIYLGDL